MCSLTPGFDLISHESVSLTAAQVESFQVVWVHGLMQLEILLPCQQADLLDITVIAFAAQTLNLKLFLTHFHGDKRYRKKFHF